MKFNFSYNKNFAFNIVWVSLKLIRSLLDADGISFSPNNHNGYDFWGDLLGKIEQYAHDNYNTYNLGTFDRIDGNKIFYTNGDWCDPVSRGRTSTGTFN